MPWTPCYDDAHVEGAKEETSARRETIVSVPAHVTLAVYASTIRRKEINDVKQKA